MGDLMVANWVYCRPVTKNKYYNVQDYSFHYNNDVRPDICEVGILLTCKRHMHDGVISQEGRVDPIDLLLKTLNYDLILT
jgi:hypothetical protein